jgi:hypothetical protein
MATNNYHELKLLADDLQATVEEKKCLHRRAIAARDEEDGNYARLNKTAHLKKEETIGRCFAETSKYRMLYAKVRGKWFLCN